ncbi:CcmE/CycJ protein [Pseudocohnilembus persalinus]|uniref:CcmE/CycJ protein n=1 Tax=Pseudocohnilembus persalinus TaxID=266149 RepID=A0A0V0Q896_PSEPJ|nr:CcmE/CycJ protein [Pseudocohnilembus persalinus]|eukprot:KRW98389.1 CcmE/CycJ protein [Pseudocohnilembus persalinus]
MIKNCLKKHHNLFQNLNKIPKTHFSALNIGQQVSSRSGLYKMLITLGSIHVISTYGAEMLLDKQVMMGVSDYIQNTNVKENSNFQIFGALKAGSMKFSRGSLDTKFEITDFNSDVEVAYSGLNKFEFKEGETLVLTAYCPNANYKNKIVATDYMTKHSMEVQNWQDKVNSTRQNYGLYQK